VYARRGKVGAEVALDEGTQEASLQAGPRRGRIERERGVDAQTARRLRDDARVQGVEQAMRLAEPERRGDPDLAAGAREDRVHRCRSAGSVRCCRRRPWARVCIGFGPDRLTGCDYVRNPMVNYNT
jgi:hypothetical protein